MPFQSEAQRRYLWMTHPEIASKWAHGQHSTKDKKGHKMSARKKKRGR